MQRVGQQNSHGRDVQQLSTAFCEPGQQVDHVEVVEQAVDESDDGVQYLRFTRVVGHGVLLSGLLESAERASVGLEL
jgi:hypothetical protein